MVDIPGDEIADDDTILSDVKVLRRIAPQQITRDHSGPRPRSDVFSNHPSGSGPSVDIWEEGRTPEDTLANHDDFGLISVTVGNIREQGLGVIRVPLEHNRHHAHIQGKKTHGKKRALARASTILKMPASTNEAG